MKKKILLSITIFAIVFLLTGCGNVPEWKKNLCEKNAIRTAKKYIKKKYNFEPNIISSEAIIQDQLFDASKFGEKLTGAKVVAEYNGKEFNIYNSCKMFKDDNDDDYQIPEIREEMAKYFEEGVKNILKDNKNVISYKVSIVPNYDFMSVREYFDKNNIDDKFLYVLDRVEIIYLGESGLSSAEKEKLSKVGYGDIKIYNIKDLNEYNKYLNEKTENDYDIPKFLLYSYDHLENSLNKGTWKQDKYNTIIDNGIHFISKAEGNFIEPVSLLTYEPITASKTFVSANRAYKVLTDAAVDIYIPAETVSAYNLYSLKLGHRELRGQEGEEYYYQDWFNLDLLKDNKKYIYYKGDRLFTNDIIDFSK